MIETDRGTGSADCLCPASDLYTGCYPCSEAGTGSGSFRNIPTTLHLTVNSRHCTEWNFVITLHYRGAGVWSGDTGGFGNMFYAELVCLQGINGGSWALIVDQVFGFDSVNSPGCVYKASYVSYPAGIYGIVNCYPFYWHISDSVVGYGRDCCDNLGTGSGTFGLGDIELYVTI